VDLIFARAAGERRNADPERRSDLKGPDELLSGSGYSNRFKGSDSFSFQGV